MKDISERLRTVGEDYDFHGNALIFEAADEIDRLRAQLAASRPAVDGAIDKARFERAPCYLCGYNGPGYYQPDTHPCAAKYHAAPQPAEQQPAPAIPEETLSPYEILGWCHAYFCCSLDAGEDPRTTEVGDIIEKMNRQLLAAAPQPAEQQPAPDVTALVEALECMIIGACAVAVPHNGERAVLQDAVNNARKALAAYRQGGEK